MKARFSNARPGQWITIDLLDYKNIDLRIKRVENIQRSVGGDEHPMIDLVLEPISGVAKDRRIKVREFVSDETQNLALMELHDEFPFDEGFAAVLKDESKKFSIDDQEFYRHNDESEPYECLSTIHEARGVRNTRKFSLHLFSRDAPDEAGTVRPEFVMVEQDSVSGMYQVWKCVSVTPYAVTLV